MESRCESAGFCFVPLIGKIFEIGIDFLHEQ